MQGLKASGQWCPEIDAMARPLYRAIVEAIRRDIASGRLTAGQKLPPQRKLAHALGVDFTTVTRAYVEARRDGLVIAQVGKGTFVNGSIAMSAPKNGRTVSDASDFIDMTMNLPPQPMEAKFAARMRAGLAAVQAHDRGLDLLRYQTGAGHIEDRETGASWLQPRLGDIDPDQIIVAPGTQSALTALLSSLAKPGDRVCTETLTYPVFRALCAQLGILAEGLPMDEFGLLPDAFRQACQTRRPKALYCCPTLHNPTAITMPEARRREIADIASQFEVPVLEDDAYGRLPVSAPAPIAAYAPDLTYLISGLSKCLAPGLRIAFVHTPGRRQAGRLAASLRATSLMATPLTAALVSEWVRNGAAEEILEAIRHDSLQRQQIAGTILAPETFQSNPEAFHGWLSLPKEWSRSEFTSHMRGAGVALVGSDAFATDANPPHAVRLCLGAARTHQDLERILWLVRDALDDLPAMSAVVG